jgi:hypothetical protein
MMCVCDGWCKLTIIVIIAITSLLPFVLFLLSHLHGWLWESLGSRTVLYINMNQFVLTHTSDIVAPSKLRKYQLA